MNHESRLRSQRNRINGVRTVAAGLATIVITLLAIPAGTMSPVPGATGFLMTDSARSRLNQGSVLFTASKADTSSKELGGKDQ